MGIGEYSSMPGALYHSFLNAFGEIALAFTATTFYSRLCLIWHLIVNMLILGLMVYVINVARDDAQVVYNKKSGSEGAL